MELYLETFDLTEMMDDIASTMRPMVEKSANTLQIQGARDLGTIHADQVKVRQALLNLLSNAVVSEAQPEAVPRVPRP
jgi:signal transduction histidine kinase